MSEEVLPCFVFDPAQCDPYENGYFGYPEPVVEHAPRAKRARELFEAAR